MRHLVPILAVLLLTLTACKPGSRTLTPEDYVPLVQVALQSGETASLITRNDRVQAGDYPGCVAAEVMASAFDSAGDALQARTEGAIEFPALTVRLDACDALPHTPPDTLQETPSDIIDAVSTTALDVATFYAGRLRARDCARGAAALASIDYVRGAKDQLLTFVEAPRPTYELTAVRVDYSSCR